MPAFKVCGRNFLIGADDLILFVPWLIVLHVILVYVDLSDSNDAVWSKIELGSLDVFSYRKPRITDAALCVSTVPVDFMISVLSALGPIMKPRRCECLLKFLVVLRCGIVIPIVLNFGWISYLLCSALIRDHHALFSESWTIWLLLLALLLRFALYINLFLVAFIIALPQDTTYEIAACAFRASLFLVGVRSPLISSLLGLITKDLVGTISLVQVTPSDWLFGFFLAAAKQRQGLLAYDPDEAEVPIEAEEEEELRVLTRPRKWGARVLPPAVKRASLLKGNPTGRPTAPLDPASPEDHAVMQEILRFMPFASAIYGQQFCMACIKDSMEPGTNQPMLCNLCRSCLCSCPCIQAHVCDSTWECLRRFGCCMPCYCCCMPAAHTEDDFSTALHEDAVHRALAKGASRVRMRPPEMHWTSWKNLGPTTSPPVGVFIDHDHKEVLVTVRGTADFKDAIADVAAEPLFFDPFNWADEGCRRTPPFSKTDLFVHGTMLLCAEDAYHRLHHKRILETLLNKSATKDYGVVCIGHSLGAGVACLLALILKTTLKEAKYVRYAGFEPPGGMLCPRLSEETQRLGWFAVVCSHDWVPRLSIKNVQKLKLLAYKELQACDRSKLQLSFLLMSGLIKQCYPLCCLRRPMARILRCLGGGALPEQDHLHGDVEEQLVPVSFDSVVTFPDLLPPGDIIYFRPVEAKYRCGFCMEKDTEWTAQWADPHDLDELILTVRAIDLHVPWVYEDAIENVAEAFEEAAAARVATDAKGCPGGMLCRSQRRK